MSVRCSVLGHDPTEQEKEVRSEDGDVTIVKIVKKCRRCGEEETIREKKRVSIAEAEEEFSDDLDGSIDRVSTTDPAAPSEGVGQPTIADGGETDGEESFTAADPDSDETEAKGDAVFIDDDTPAEPTSTEQDTSSAETTTDSAERTESPPAQETSDDKSPSADEDGGIIIGDDDAEDVSDTQPDQSANTTGDEDEFNTDAFNGDVTNDDSEEEDSLDEGMILTPDGEEEPASTSESTSSDSFGGSMGGKTEEGDLTCDTCRFSVEKEGTPIRIGDICSNCKQGYIEQE